MPFSFFQISNYYCQKSSGKIILFYNGFLIKFYYMANVFDLQIFDNETTALLILKFAWKSVLLFYLLLFFLNDRNIVTSLSTIHFKCWSIPKTVWHFQKKKTFLQSNFLKICLEQFKLSGHVELEKWNMFAFSNL